MSSDDNNVVKPTVTKVDEEIKIISEEKKANSIFATPYVAPEKEKEKEECDGGDSGDDVSNLMNSKE
jgi:hypothetical protein